MMSEVHLRQYRISPNYPDHLPCMPCSLPRWTEQVLVGFFPIRAAFPGTARPLKIAEDSLFGLVIFSVVHVGVGIRRAVQFGLQKTLLQHRAKLFQGSICVNEIVPIPDESRVRPRRVQP